MTANFMTDFIKIIFNQEIANHYTIHKHTITIDLSNGNQATITAVKLTRVPQKASTIIISPQANFYVQNHNFGYTADTITVPYKITLRNLDDCCAYLVNACRTQLHAKFENFLLTFPTGDKYLLKIQNQSMLNINE